ncbi:MAG: hypothetical protein JO061_24105 [Acidobacteriaceae bacterium]|nr:hypothetical protein [Acidobacteriaceae bacterium]
MTAPRTEADDDQALGTAAIIDKFVEATQSHEDALRGASMQVNIDASIPKLKEHGKLRALRKISKVGTVTYRVLGFQGDNTVKNDVIARYLQAEQQGQGDQNLAISPQNYKFKFKGRRAEGGQDVYMFQISPRKKRVGLFKGDLWLDAKTCLPVMEKGRLVRNPSIWFKKVQFERDFAVKNGVAVPEHMSSTIDVRLIGPVHLDIDYSDFEQNADADSDDTGQAGAVAMAGSMGK